MKSVLDDILGQSLRTEFVQADVSPLPAHHSTGWRTMPFFMYSQAGTGSEIIWLENGEKWKAAPGELIVLPAGIRHKVDVASAHEIRQWAHVNYFILGTLDLFDILEAPVLVADRIGRKIGRVIHEWIHRQTANQEEPMLRIVKQHELALRLLALLAPACRWKSGAQEKMDGLQRLNPVIQYMQDHLHEPMNRNDLARRSGLSPAQFHVVFSSIMRSTPMGYLRALRLRQAQRLLIMTSAPVKQVAIQSGYEDPFVFCKFFKRACGHSPSEYREIVRLK